MLKKTATFMSAFCATLGLGAGIAAAHTQVFPTDASMMSTVSGPSGFRASGVLGSSKAACVRGREVRGVSRPAEGRFVFDVDFTSSNGAWLLQSDESESVSNFLLVAPRKQIGPSSHRHYCGALKRTP